MEKMLSSLQMEKALLIAGSSLLRLAETLLIAGSLHRLSPLWNRVVVYATSMLFWQAGKSISILENHLSPQVESKVATIHGLLIFLPLAKEP